MLHILTAFKFNMQFLPCQAGLPDDGVVNELAAQNVIRGPEDGGRNCSGTQTAQLLCPAPGPPVAPLSQIPPEVVLKEGA